MENNQKNQYRRRKILQTTASVAGSGIISGCGASNNDAYDGADIQNVFIQITEDGNANFVAIFDTTVPSDVEAQREAFKTGTPDQFTDRQSTSFEISTLRSVDGSIERVNYNPINESKFPRRKMITGQYNQIQNNTPSWSGDHSWYRLPAVEFIDDIGRKIKSNSNFANENTTFVISYPTGTQQSFPLQYKNAETVSNNVVVDISNNNQDFDSSEIFSAYNNSGTGLPFQLGSVSPSSQTAMVGSIYDDNIHLSRVVSSSEFKFSAHFEVYRRLNFEIQKEEAIAAVDDIFAETYQELTIKLLLSTLSAGAPPSGGAAIRGGDLFAQTTDLFENQVTLSESINQALNQAKRTKDLAELPWVQRISRDSNPPNMKTLVDLISVERDFASLLPNSTALSRFEIMLNGYIDLLSAQIGVAEDLSQMVYMNVPHNNYQKNLFELTKGFIEKIMDISKAQKKELEMITVPGSISETTPTTTQTATPTPPEVTRVDSFAPTRLDGGDDFGSRIGLRRDTAVIGRSSDPEPSTGYVYKKTDDMWEQVDTITDNTTGINRFPTGIGFISDFVLVGREYDGLYENAGVEVFAPDREGWSRRNEIVPENNEPGLHFGTEISTDGNTAFISDPYIKEGRVYVYSLTQEGWTRPRPPLTGAKRGAFGFSLDASSERLIVGQPTLQQPQSDSNTGSVHIYETPRSDSAEETKNMIRGNEVDSGFGSAVGIDGNTAIVGAQRAGSQDEGAAYIYIRNDGEWSKEQCLQPANLSENASFGEELSFEDNILFVSAPLDGGENKADTSGEVYAYLRNGSAWSDPVKLAPDEIRDESYFGGQVALSGNTLLVGALDDASFVSNDISGGGAVYEYRVDRY